MKSRFWAMLFATCIISVFDALALPAFGFPALGLSAFELPTFGLHAQDSTRSSEFSPPSALPIDRIIVQDFDAALADAGLYFTAPLRFSLGDWAISAGTVGGTVALFSADESLRRTIQTFRNPTNTPLTDPLAEAARLYGETLVGGGIGAAVYLGGLVVQDDYTRVTGRLVLEALVFSGSLNLVMKSAFGRSRPYLNEGATAFSPVQFSMDKTSLPSAHATVAFAISSVLAERFQNPFATVGLYALASLTGLSRMYHDVHWASDVFLGAAIGTGAGLAVTYFERERARSVKESHSLHIYPTLNGVALTYIFR